MRKVDPARYRAKRRSIMDAAAPLFATHGPDGTSTAAIRRAAGVSSGALFHYFPSKRAVFVALLTDEEGDNADRITAARTHEDPWQALLDLVEHLAAPAGSPVAAGLVMEGLRQAQRDPELAEALETDSDTELEALTHLVTRAAREHRTEPVLGPRATAGWIQTLIGALFLRAATEPGFDAAAHVRDLRALLSRLLGCTTG
ncbi:TetR/AcrR family transcriptional regulator [Nocardiopsis xinjiangensis]|uniref:TetR/AcrR family transcriptional regulator n=1 Tax=Nocardiopsis xinjiangensis TaxID=124285 RepID=UPI0003472DE2|nr:TetR/AcrR family transcriptional regulator [Nocardiopsis xinjiangensis]